VDSFLVLLVEDAILLQLKTAFLLTAAKIFEAPLQFTAQEREERCLSGNFVDVCQLVLSYPKLLQESNNLQF
jgi:hypothetical protein